MSDTDPESYYFAEGGERSWDRESCDPIGLDMLLAWADRNKVAVTKVVVTYEPDKTKPDPLQAWTIEPG